LQLIDSGNRDPIEGLKQTIYQLKNFAKQNNTVVIAISATNRASNKTGTVELESGRDTSAVEYSGDMVLGLSYTALEDRRKYDTGERDRNGNPKEEEYTLNDLRRMRQTAYDLGQDPPSICNEISLKVMKNRFGAPEKRAKLFFDGRHNIYTLVYTPVNIKTPFDDEKKSRLPVL
jgi:replicative DNA helicase